MQITTNTWGKRVGIDKLGNEIPITRVNIPKFKHNQKDYKVGFCAGLQECARRERRRKRATKD